MAAEKSVEAHGSVASAVRPKRPKIDVTWDHIVVSIKSHCYLGVPSGYRGYHICSVQADLLSKNVDAMGPKQAVARIPTRCSPMSSPRQRSVAELLAAQANRKAASARIAAARSAHISEDSDGSDPEYWDETPRGDKLDEGKDTLVGITAKDVPRMPTAGAWFRWAPTMQPHDLPSLAVAALADAVVASGATPEMIVSDLRAELIEAVAANTADDAAGDKAVIDRLEMELCCGAPPDACAKCRSTVKGRTSPMVVCGHRVLCAMCAVAVQVQTGADGPKAASMSRLLCPVCRGLEAEVDETAETAFALVDRGHRDSVTLEDVITYLLVGTGQVRDTTLNTQHLLLTTHCLLLTPHY